MGCALGGASSKRRSESIIVLPTKRTRLAVDPLGGQVRRGLGAVREEEIGHPVGQDPVDLLGHRPVERAQAGLDVGHRDAELGGGQRGGERRVDVAADAHEVGALVEQEALERLQHARRLRPVGPRADAEEDVGLGEPEVRQHLGRQALVVVLPGVDHPLGDLRPVRQRRDDRGHLDEVRARADDLDHASRRHRPRPKQIVLPSGRPGREHFRHPETGTWGIACVATAPPRVSAVERTGAPGGAEPDLSWPRPWPLLLPSTSPRGPLPRRRARPQRVGRARRLPRARPVRRAVVALAARARRRPPPPAGDRAAARALAVRRAPALSPPPSADRQGTRGLRLGRGARAASRPHAAAPRDAGLRALQSCSTPTAAPDRDGWGYPWDVQTRWSFYPAGSPNVVVTAFAASGAARGRRRAGARRPRRPRAVRPRAGSCDELWVEPEGYFAYHGGRPVNIHNASLLGAWLVDVAGGADGSPASASRAPCSERSTRSAPTGRGRTARGANLAWADSFHSGYVLLCLDRLRDVDGRVGEAVAARRGPLPRASSTPAGARSCGRTSRFPRMRTRRARA